MQNSARFRVANNVFQTRDDYMIPRYHGAQYLAQDKFTEAERVVGLTRYKDKPFTVAIDNESGYIFYDKDGNKIPQPEITPGSMCDVGYNLISSGPQYVEKLGNLYIGLPFNRLYKYDGAQVYRAGVPLPYFSCAQRDDAGATYVRVLQHHLDFQGNNVYSGYIQFRATPDGSNNIILRTDRLATDIVGATSVEPVARPVWEQFDGTYDEFYFRSSAGVVNSGLNEIVLTTGGNHKVGVGAYLLISPQYQPTSVTSLPDSYGIAMRVKAVSGTTVTLDLLNARYLDRNREWQFGNILSTALLLNSLPEGVNYWLSVWTSNAATAAYVFKGVCPAAYRSTTSQTFTIGVASPTIAAIGSENLTWVVAPIMGDFYDVTSEKGVLPTSFQGSSINSCFSTYGDLMLMSYLNEIYFSDTTLGGSFEMVNGLSFILVGEGDDGNIQTVCGTSDFMLISRQYKNYYLTGTLQTANYRVSEISETSLGAYSNESSLAVNDKIIFFNKQGIWAVYTGGRCEEVSYNIRGFFDNFSGTTAFDEEAYFDLSSFPTYATYYGILPDLYSKWIRLRVDVNRNLLAFLIKGADGMGQVLVLNLNNGEFYTWSGLTQAFPFVGTPNMCDMCFVNGDYYVTVNYNTRAVYVENKTIPRPIDYMTGVYRPRLKSTWFTAGEPSLEKKTKQVKMWGIIKGIVAIKHALDWTRTQSVDDGSYTSTDDELFSHKKRMDSSNALACSVDLEFSGDRFELEGLELEFEPFQMGMKR